MKINRVPDSPNDYVCTQFDQNALKDVDSRVFTRMLWKDGSVTISISLRNFIGKGITSQLKRSEVKTTYCVVSNYSASERLNSTM